MHNIAALIGLIGAVNNSEKTEDTDDIIRMGLLNDDSQEIIDMIHEEKFKISPGCKTCAAPCGNTSDYDLSKMADDSANIKELKANIINELMRIAKSEGELSDNVYRGIAFLGYNLEERPYMKLLNELKGE